MGDLGSSSMTEHSVETRQKSVGGRPEGQQTKQKVTVREEEKLCFH